MKQSDFKQYDNNELREMYRNLKNPKSYNKLPVVIFEFITNKNAEVGNSSTRSVRCILLIKEEMCRRFMNEKSIFLA